MYYYTARVVDRKREGVECSRESSERKTERRQRKTGAEIKQRNEQIKEEEMCEEWREGMIDRILRWTETADEEKEDEQSKRSLYAESQIYTVYTPRGQREM